MSEKQCKVSETFYVAVQTLLVKMRMEYMPMSLEGLCSVLEAEIEAREHAKARKVFFTAYKTAAPGSQAREHYRQMYLENSGITNDFVSKKETSLCPPCDNVPE
jgi:hypothetical protein